MGSKNDWSSGNSGRRLALRGSDSLQAPVVLGGVSRDATSICYMRQGGGGGGVRVLWSTGAPTTSSLKYGGAGICPSPRGDLERSQPAQCTMLHNRFEDSAASSASYYSCVGDDDETIDNETHHYDGEILDNI